MSTAIGRSRYLTNFEPNRLPHLFTDVLVIGSGVAGLRAAIEAADECDVLLVTKDAVENSNTSYAQGGVAAAIAPGDSPEKHGDDTRNVACRLGHEKIIQQVVFEAPVMIEELLSWGANFDCGDNESVAYGREGGHGMPRIIHSHGDATGREFVRVLLDQARKHPRIRIFDHCFAIDILTNNGEAVGAVTYHPKYGHQMFWATTTIIATGGAGCVYRETTNPSIATGDGVAMAFRAGATLRDMEMVQFHPTTLYVAGAARALISEAVRGEGAYLCDRDGSRFMAKYDDRAELASRDVVSRAIMSEMKLGGMPCAFLDVRHFAPGRFAERFPNLNQLCQDVEIDPENDLIPVRPSAHYAVGGILVDVDTQTSVPGLLAAGEAASTGLHGANRLASNSLLEGLVYGKRAGEIAVARTKALGRIDQPHRVSNIVPPSPRTPLDLDDIEHSLRSVMSRNVAVERSADRLRETMEIIEFWTRYTMDKVFDEPKAWEIQNILTIAYCVTIGASTRTESRGVHYRTDFPEADDEQWRCHVDMIRGDHGVQVFTTPVSDDC